MGNAGLVEKAVLLTGAGYGLGRAVALEFAKAGAELVFRRSDYDSLSEGVG